MIVNGEKYSLDAKSELEEKKMTEKEFELTRKNEELTFQLEKLNCALKIFMSKSTISKEEADILSNFDEAINKEEVKEIYKSFLKKKTI